MQLPFMPKCPVCTSDGRSVNLRLTQSHKCKSQFFAIDISLASVISMVELGLLCLCVNPFTQSSPETLSEPLLWVPFETEAL